VLVKKKTLSIGLILLLIISIMTNVIQKPIADTQNSFILMSAGKDGQIGTSDDIAATESQKATVNKAVNISVTESVPSAGVVTKEAGTEPKPLRQPNSDEIPIYTPEELAKIGVDPNYPLSGKYILMANIDLSSYSNWVPIGNNSKPFTGQFDGNGLVIKNLTINRPSSDYQGLFGYTGSIAKIVNVALENVSVTGYNYTGGLVGVNSGTITNSHSTGSVTGNGSTGGLVGYNYEGTITNSYSIGNVTGNGSTGGLAGYNCGTITNSYSTSSVTGYNYTGGLVGFNNQGTITNSYSTGSISSSHYTGGLVGFNNHGAITSSYSTGSVKGGSYTGGLVGDQYFGAITSSYWDTQTSGLTTSAGGTGKTTAQMKTQATFVNWDFTNVWAIDEGKSYPYLRTNEQVPHPGTN
jgi:hypothetical protein